MSAMRPFRIWQILLLMVLLPGCTAPNREPANSPQPTHTSDSLREAPGAQDEPVTPPPILLDPGFDPTPAPPPLPTALPTPLGKEILFLSGEGSQNPRSYLAQNLWSVSLDSGRLVALTQDMVVDNYSLSPDEQWIVLGGYHLYEQAEGTDTRDVWLIDWNNKLFYRLTNDPGDQWPVGWSPDGSSPVVWDGENLFLLTSSGNSQLQAIPNTADFVVGGSK